MSTFPSGTIAVIFCAQRTDEDDEGYATATAAMSALAARQPGYLAMDSSRSSDGFGITISYWTNDKAAKAWRDNQEHSAIRKQGRGKWYENYSLHVAQVERSYDWEK